MKDLNKNISETIKKHLPELAAKELKEFIEEANISIKENVELKAELERKENLLHKFQQENLRFENGANKVEAQRVANGVKEIELEKKEIRAEVERLKFENAVTALRVTDSKEFMLMLAKNPRAIEYMSKSSFENIPLVDQYGSTRFESKTSNTNGSKEIVESKELTGPGLGQ